MKINCIICLWRGSLKWFENSRRLGAYIKHYIMVIFKRNKEQKLLNGLETVVREDILKTNFVIFRRKKPDKVKYL